jgi:LuxR family maltose regulon positive regulatory protein
MLPDAMRQQRPGLLLAEAWSAYERFQFDRLAAILEQAGALPGAGEEVPAVAGELALLRGEVEYWQGHGRKSRRLFDKARTLLPQQQGLVRGLLELQHGLALCMEGRTERALKDLKGLITKTGARQGIYLSRLVAGLYFVRQLSGHLVPARSVAQRLRAVARKSRIAYTDAWSWYMEAVTCLQAGDLKPAEELFTAAAGQRYILHSRAAVDALAGLALTRQLAGRADAAEESVTQLQAFALELGDSQYQAVADSCRARLALLRGDPAWAVGWARTFEGVAVPAELFMWLEVPVLTQARLLAAAASAEDLRRAGSLLRDTRQQAEACRFVNQVIEAMVLQSLTLAKLEQVDEALAVLEEAVGLAETHGWRRPFLEAGPPVAGLLRQLPGKKSAVGFVESLLAAVEPEATADHPPRTAADAQPLIEPLTNRELDVLELLAERLRDKEIAERLFVSPTTVKTHLKHIYQKLCAENRRQAVEKARAIGILHKRHP